MTGNTHEVDFEAAFESAWAIADYCYYPQRAPADGDLVIIESGCDPELLGEIQADIRANGLCMSQYVGTLNSHCGTYSVWRLQKVGSR